MVGITKLFMKCLKQYITGGCNENKEIIEKIQKW